MWFTRGQIKCKWVIFLSATRSLKSEWALFDFIAPLQPPPPFPAPRNWVTALGTKILLVYIRLLTHALNLQLHYILSAVTAVVRMINYPNFVLLNTLTLNQKNTEISLMSSEKRHVLKCNRRYILRGSRGCNGEAQGHAACLNVLALKLGSS